MKIIHIKNQLRVSVWEDEKFLEMDGSRGCTTAGAYLMSLNFTLKHG